MRRVYLDSCFVIYLMEDTAIFSEQARRFFARNADVHVYVSPLVRLEVLVQPLRNGNKNLVEDYGDFLDSLSFLPITSEVFDQALHLRVHFRLKTPDALHLATAQYHGCDELWTNDDRLNEVAGVMAVNVFTSTHTPN